MEVRGEGEWHHGWLPTLCRDCHGGLRGGGDPWWERKKKKQRHVKAFHHPHLVYMSVCLYFMVFKFWLFTVAGNADAEVGEVGSQAACAIGWAEGGEGHCVLWVQWGGQRRGELDVGQIREGTSSVVRSWKHGGVQLLVWWWEDTKKGQEKLLSNHSVLFLMPYLNT